MAQDGRDGARRVRWRKTGAMARDGGNEGEQGREGATRAHGCRGARAPMTPRPAQLDERRREGKRGKRAEGGQWGVGWGKEGRTTRVACKCAGIRLSHARTAASVSNGIHSNIQAETFMRKLRK
ncbi:hypothetical protein DENSPDRAFT_855540 [Dentipellis sp. KUC8613]|nr:hypothetical protein DENSPDRAFT_855540 [Dentipellis sp. KUC8613]